MAVYAVRSAFCLFSLGATVSALRAARLSQVPASSPSIPEAAILRYPGTGKLELEELKIMQYLGPDGLTSERFLVKDKDGTIKVLRRFLREAEKMEKSRVYAFVHIIFFPFSLFSIFVNQIAAEVKNILHFLLLTILVFSAFLKKLKIPIQKHLRRGHESQIHTC